MGEGWPVGGALPAAGSASVGVLVTSDLWPPSVLSPPSLSVLQRHNKVETRVSLKLLSSRAGAKCLSAKAFLKAAFVTFIEQIKISRRPTFWRPRTMAATSGGFASHRIASYQMLGNLWVQPSNNGGTLNLRLPFKAGGPLRKALTETIYQPRR